MGIRPVINQAALAEIQAEYNVLVTEFERLRAELDEKDLPLAQAKAELSVMVAQIFGRLIRAYGSPEIVAARARIEEQDLWWLLSGEFPRQRRSEQTSIVKFSETSENLKNIVLSLARLDADEPWKIAAEAGQYVDRYVRLFEEYRTLSGRRQEVRIQMDRARRLMEQARSGAQLNQQEMQQSVRPSQPPPAPRPAPPRDVQGHECKPDPLQARTPGEFIDMLASYRRWAGNPSFREMERNAAGQACYSTFSNLLRSKGVPPRLKTVEAFVLALGGDEEDRRRWATAWRRFQALGDERSTQLAGGTDELTMIRGGLGERRTG